VSRVERDARERIKRYLPEHPDPNTEGYVKPPNVNLIEEQANLIGASRAFDANLLVIQKSEEMDDALLRVGQ